VDESYCVATFKSIHHVLKAEQALKDRGIWTDMIPNPRTLIADCGMALLFRCSDAASVKQAISDQSAPLSKIFRKEGKDFVLLEGDESHDNR